jgi:hypothetical protein
MKMWMKEIMRITLKNMIMMMMSAKLVDDKQ